MRPQQPTDAAPADMRVSGDAPAVADAADACPRCLKPAALCICDAVTPIDNKVGLLVLQHPQEQDRLLGTARLAALHLTKDRELVILDKKGVAIPDQDRALAGVKGIVIFDGTWAQAKTLWWRNAWVLKAKRLVLNPQRASLYGGLRREPRREGLSTIEAAALTLSRMEQRPQIETALRESFALMLARYRSAESQGALGDRAARGSSGSTAEA